MVENSSSQKLGEIKRHFLLIQSLNYQYLIVYQHAYGGELGEVAEVVQVAPVGDSRLA